MDWCPVAGVISLDKDNNRTYEYIYDLPDEGIDVGDCFTPHIYDATQQGKNFNVDEKTSYTEPNINIGKPYLSPD